MLRPLAGVRAPERLVTVRFQEDQWNVRVPPAAYSDLRHAATPWLEDRVGDSYRHFFGRLGAGVSIAQA
ncbi:MAG: hypothetical protein WEF86_11705 [Gemmatimonadota bacterium]